MDYEGLIPQRTEKLPTTGGHVEASWRDLDRAALMGILAFVRDDFIAQWRARSEARGEDVDIALATLQSIRRLVLDLLSRVPDERFEERPPGEAWSCHDLVNHLAIDEYNEFHPPPPASLSHVIAQDSIHLAQLERILGRLGL